VQDRQGEALGGDRVHDDDSHAQLAQHSMQFSVAEPMN
jgi:hypothetical protein